MAFTKWDIRQAVAQHLKKQYDTELETKASDYIAFYQKKVDEGSNYAKELEQCTRLAAHLRAFNR